MREVPDPRHPKSRRHPLSAMLTLISLGLLMGARDVLDIWRKVACLSQSQREVIGLRVREQSKRLKMPGSMCSTTCWPPWNPTPTPMR